MMDPQNITIICLKRGTNERGKNFSEGEDLSEKGGYCTLDRQWKKGHYERKDR